MLGILLPRVNYLFRLATQTASYNTVLPCNLIRPATSFQNKPLMSLLNKTPSFNKANTMLPFYSQRLLHSSSRAHLCKHIPISGRKSNLVPLPLI